VVMDDDELIAALAAGDDTALRELFVRHSPAGPLICVQRSEGQRPRGAASSSVREQAREYGCFGDLGFPGRGEQRH